MSNKENGIKSHRSKVVGLAAIVIIIASAMAVSAWVFTTPPDGNFTSNGYRQGNISLDNRNVTVDRLDIMGIFGVVIGSYSDSITCDGEYCIYRPKYVSGKVYAKNMSTGEIEVSGTSFYTAINTAISNLESGRTIRILEGSYVLGAQLNINKTINIIGNGNNTFIDVSNGIIPFYFNDTSNVKLKDFSLDVSNRNGINFYNATNTEISGLNITGNFVPTGSRTAIYFRNGSRNNIHDNYISGNGWDNAIQITNGEGYEEQYNTINHNIIYDLGGAHATLASGIAIEVTSAGSYYVPSRGNIITNNICSNVTDYCLRLISSQSNIIDGNIGNTTRSMIWTSSNINFSDNVVVNNIAKNTFPAGTTSGSWAVYQISGNNNSITNNHAIDSNGTKALELSIYSYNNTVRNNYFINTTGVSLNNSNAVADNFGVSPFYWGNSASCTAISTFGGGDSCYNTTSKAFNFYDGAQWRYYNMTTVNSY